MWLVWPWLACALSAIALPWLLFEPVTGVAPGVTLAFAELWSALWPVGIGVLAAFLLVRVELPAVAPEMCFSCSRVPDRTSAHGLENPSSG